MSYVLDIPALASSELYGLVGSGRREADVISPVQDQLTAWIGLTRERIPGATVDELQALHADALQVAADYRAFVSDEAFTDGRASRQSLDAIMPYLDGTRADGTLVAVTIHGNPTDGGLVGELERAILERGGAVAPALSFTQGAGGQSVDTGARFGISEANTLPQAGMIPPAITELWAHVTGRTATGEADPGAVAQQAAMIQWLLIGGVLYALFRRGG